ncbi:MAG TPA: hypothetical protein VM910_36500 [Bradyrhizobium sp.]|jgi:hypothetical protein|nr:hypothetical protein [Bradyrhizobium sp.]
MKRIDRDALERCIATMRNSKEPSDRMQIERALAEDGWQEAADSAAYHCQMNALRLRPWQSPPCWINTRDITSIIARGDDSIAGDYAAAKLLQKMLQASLSRFEPDPVAALKRTNPPRAA